MTGTPLKGLTRLISIGANAPHAAERTKATSKTSRRLASRRKHEKCIMVGNGKLRQDAAAPGRSSAGLPDFGLLALTPALECG